MSGIETNASAACAARRIVVIGTGGTIAGTGERSNSNIAYEAATLTVVDLLADIEAPAGFLLELEQVAQLDSKDMDFETWQVLRQRCAHWLAQPDVVGIVITHGTDTLEETAFFLQAVLESGKPVVLTCAMRPATAQASDGPQNLRDALAVVTQGSAEGVVVVCAGEIHGARNVRKDHPYRTNVFGSGDAGPIGYVEEGQVRQVRCWPQPSPVSGETLSVLARPATTWPRVEIILSHAGARGNLIDALVRERLEGRHEAVEGLVVAATGNGSLHQALEQAVSRAQAAGIKVWRATRCANGRVVSLPAASVIPDAGDLSPVKARISLMLSLIGYLRKAYRA